MRRRLGGHGARVEIRVPLVDFALFGKLAPAVPTLVPGAGKVALAEAPSLPLPHEVVGRPKTGFGVPTGAWMSIAATETPNPAYSSKGVISRRGRRPSCRLAQRNDTRTLPRPRDRCVWRTWWHRPVQPRFSQRVGGVRGDGRCGSASRTRSRLIPGGVRQGPARRQRFAYTCSVLFRAPASASMSWSAGTFTWRR